MAVAPAAAPLDEGRATTLEALRVYIIPAEAPSLHAVTLGDAAVRGGAPPRLAPREGSVGVAPT